MIDIQLLDIVYTDKNVKNSILDTSLATTLQSNWSVGSNTRTAVFDPVQSGGAKYMYFVTPPLTDGVEYELNFKVTDYNGGGGGNDKLGFSTWGSSAANGISGAARLAGNGSYSETFTAINSSQTGGNAVKLFVHSGVSGTLTEMHITPVKSINFDDSVIGNLDVGNHADFPLALTFSISELRDITSKKGTYSKTFKLPATKNNNKIYKGVYLPTSIHGRNTITDKEENLITEMKPCRIMVNQLYSIVGKLQLTAVGSSGSPDYYSCVFYGNNIDWTADLKDGLLKDLKVYGGIAGSGWDTLNGKTGTSLGLNYSGVTSTWTEDDADTGSPIVYPIQELGQMNVGSSPNAQGSLQSMNCMQNYYERHGGSSSKVGYWGWDSNGNAYGTMVPEVDWRPCIWVYDIFKQIFSGLGYSISSNFIESSAFKKLLLSTPNFTYNNPADRYALYSTQTTFSGTPTAGDPANLDFYDQFNGTASSWTWSSKTILFNNNNTMVVNSEYADLYDGNVYGYFEIEEYGFYNIDIDNFSAAICDLVHNASGTGQVCIGYVKMWIEVQTAGESYSDWSWIATSYAIPIGFTYLDGTEVHMDWKFEKLSIENRYFNKGDKIRFRMKTKAKGSAGGAVYEFKTYVYSGSALATSGAAGTCGWGSSGSNGYINIRMQQPELPCWGQTYDLKNIINEDYTQMDFIRGIAHAFNLQFSTETDSRMVVIEPYNDFYLNPSTNTSFMSGHNAFGRQNTNGSVDWTYKVDRSKTTEDSWLTKKSLSREMIFKYKSDSNDKKVEERGDTYWGGIADEYPYKEILGDPFDPGTITFENPFFAGTYNTLSYTASIYNAYIPAYWGECESGAMPTGWGGCRPVQGHNFQPRLLAWYKYQCSDNNPTYPWAYASITIWSTNTTQYISSRNATACPTCDFNTFPQAVSYNKINSQNPLTHSLTYGSVWSKTYDCSTGTLGYNTSQKGLYQTYYQKMIEQIKSNPRIRTVYVDLKIEDIVGLNFRKLVYLDEVYWRINKIIDYQPNNNTTTKVELIQYSFLGDKPSQTGFPITG